MTRDCYMNFILAGQRRRVKSWIICSQIH